MQVIIYILVGSKTDFSIQNRHEIARTDIMPGELEIGDIVEITTIKKDKTKKVRHFLVKKIDERENLTAIFVEKVGMEEK